MADNLTLLLEAERRGILPPEKAGLLLEARKRGIVPQLDSEATPPTAADPSSSYQLGSDLENFGAGVKKSVGDLGRGIKQLGALALDQVSPQKELSSLVTGKDTSRYAKLQREQDEIDNYYSPLLKTKAGFGGNVLGTVGSFLIPGAAVGRVAQAANFARTANIAKALTAPKTLGGAAASGATLSALQPVGEQGSRAINTAIGAVAGLGGQAISKGVAKVLRPTAAADAQRAALIAEAQRRGIPLDVGDLTGSKPIQIAESVLSNIPGSAGKEANRKAAKQGAYNSAVANSIGEQADKITPDVLRTARSRIGGEFNRLSNARTVQLGNDLTNALVDVDTQTAAVRGILDTSQIDDLINRTLNLAARGSVDGRVAQTIRSELSTAANDAARAGNTRLSQALKKVREGVDSSIRSGLTTDEKAAWDVARQQWGNMKAVERAMSQNSNATTGDVTGAALLNSLKTSGTPLSRQSNELKTLGQVGQMFVKPQIPDSGTAQRNMITEMLKLGGTAALGGTAVGVDPLEAGAAGAAVPLAALVAQPALRSKLITQYLTKGAAPNASPQALELARALQRVSGPTAAAGLLEAQ